MPNLTMIVLAVAQGVILLLLAPLMTGVSRMIRARMHSRRGPGVLQDYRDLAKLFKRQDVAPAVSGGVFRAAPYVILGTMFLLAMALPAFTRTSPLPFLADLITFAYLFALVRFFFSLSGIDSGSAFGGLGAGRELTLGILVEPTMILSLLVVALIEGTTNLGAIGAGIGGNYLQAPAAIGLAMLAFAFTVFIEMGKLPFDMAEAEQELQEGPLTEYSGPSLALMKLGLGLKKVVMAQFLLGVFLPFGVAASLAPASLALAAVALPLKLLAVFTLAGLIENSMARGRFLLTSRVTWVGFGLAALSFVFYLTGL
ncbi:MAG: respiratory chain complex I subunit 1 family protein [Paludibacterium sp.]|uniref:respiratory chain complex I subunit 1 family protein n=1 Tax=Paludibacterium sp. TaxID=1917523 RepID=UPI0025F955FC|nr:respiratory chain complex I subunit 1 family protein [Paludibacterium sp.]MBV8047098.1 respiratory chain complex I subunit 1 family protein [Paludibacterium sp.]MBV8648817.1 respiratory chain complex I subunit 1 family protein [Paludibacterium sp.]